jgi:hypothetical protein
MERDHTRVETTWPSQIFSSAPRITDSMITSSTGTSAKPPVVPVATAAMSSMTGMPSMTCPKTV